MGGEVGWGVGRPRDRAAGVLAVSVLELGAAQPNASLSGAPVFLKAGPPQASPDAAAAPGLHCPCLWPRFKWPEEAGGLPAEGRLLNVALGPPGFCSLLERSRRWARPVCRAPSCVRRGFPGLCGTEGERGLPAVEPHTRQGHGGAAIGMAHTWANGSCSPLQSSDSSPRAFPPAKPRRCLPPRGLRPPTCLPPEGAAGTGASHVSDRPLGAATSPSPRLSLCCVRRAWASPCQRPGSRGSGGGCWEGGAVRV